LLATECSGSSGNAGMESRETSRQSPLCQYDYVYR
jgi:hypothetical protein